jgi:multiple sugar transport system ATP-binding protein
MSSVTLRGVQKRFGALQIIPQLNLDIAEHEFVTLVGPSGCGKSTLLRMIAGLEEASGGDILIDGHRVNDVPPMHRDVAMVFQSYALYPHMTVQDNMSFGLRLRRMAADAIRARVDDAAALLNLGTLTARRPGQLSGGQRQRVAMGRAMVRDPKLFLFDEPLSNLDAKLRVQMRTEIRALHRRLHATSIYVTHDQVEAMTMADRIVVMHGGEIEQVGAPEELYDAPANLFVGGFIGSPAMNFLRGTATDGVFVLDDGTRLAGIVPPAQNGQAIVLGIRPEHVRIDATEPVAPANVQEIEPTGADTLVLCTMGTQTVTASLRDRVHLGLGAAIALGFAPDRLHWFDGASGLALRRQ